MKRRTGNLEGNNIYVNYSVVILGVGIWEKSNSSNIQ